MLLQAAPIAGLDEIELFATNIFTETAKKLVQLHLKLIAASTSFDNTLVTVMAAEKYFAVKLQLVGCKTI